MTEENKGTETPSTSEENQPGLEEKPKEAPTEEQPKEAPKSDTNIDYTKELQELEDKSPEVPKRSEAEKAEFSVNKIFEKHPALKDKFTKEKKPANDDTEQHAFDELSQKLHRNQVESIIRQNAKSDAEVKYKMWFYDNRTVKTDNPFDDADNAQWLADKNRTRNAIKEMRDKPDIPGQTTGAGQKPPMNNAPDLPPQEVKRLVDAGFKRVSSGKWEGTRFDLVWSAKEKAWEQISK